MPNGYQGVKMAFICENRDQTKSPVILSRSINKICLHVKLDQIAVQIDREPQLTMTLSIRHDVVCKQGRVTKQLWNLGFINF